MDNSISVLKFLLILSIVFGHIGFSSSGNGSNLHTFVYFYHMPLFFFMSGCIYKKESLKQMVLSGIKKLYIPFIICSTIFILCRNIFIHLGFYKVGQVANLAELLNLRTFIDVFSFRYIEPLLGIIWVVPCLFFVKVIFSIINEFIIKIRFLSDSRDILLPIIVTVLFMIGLNKGLSKNFMKFQFDIVLVAMFFYYLGIEFVNSKEKFQIKGTIAVVLGIIMIQNIKFGFVDMNNRSYINSAFFLFNSLSGIYINLALVKLVEWIQSQKIKRVVYSIGDSFFLILVLHFTVFKIITLIIIKLDNLPMEYLSNIFPGDIIWLSWLWLLIYLISAIIIPSIVNILIKRLIRRLIYYKDMNIIEKCK